MFFAGNYTNGYPTTTLQIDIEAAIGYEGTAVLQSVAWNCQGGRHLIYSPEYENVFPASCKFSMILFQNFQHVHEIKSFQASFASKHFLTYMLLKVFFFTMQYIILKGSYFTNLFNSLERVNMYLTGDLYQIHRQSILRLQLVMDEQLYCSQSGLKQS